MEKARILEEIKRTAAENGGVPLGQDRFVETTGIARSAWFGRYWRNWGEAVTEAGLTPNRFKEPIARDTLAIRLLALTRTLGRLPTYADMRKARDDDKEIPEEGAFRRLGKHAERVEVLRRYATENAEYRDVLDILPPAVPAANPETGRTDENTLADGSVYMLKLGKHYKIGKTFSVPRRHNEISLELPEKPDIVHVIATDDPSGIEAYWHKRFESKHTNGEWFALTRDDIRAFKRRKFM